VTVVKENNGINFKKPNNKSLSIDNNIPLMFQNLKKPKIDSLSQTNNLNTKESKKKDDKPIKNKEKNKKIYSIENINTNLRKNMTINNQHSRNISSQLSKIAKTTKLIKEISKSNEKLKKELEKISPSKNNYSIKKKVKEESPNKSLFNPPYSYKYTFKEDPYYIPSTFNKNNLSNNNLSYNKNKNDYEKDLNSENNLNKDYKAMLRNQSQKYLNNNYNYYNNKPNKYLNNSKSLTQYNIPLNEKIQNLIDDYSKIESDNNYKNNKNSSSDIYNIPNISQNNIYNKSRITYELKNKRNNSYSSMKVNNNLFTTNNNISKITFQNNNIYNFNNNQLNENNINSIYQRRNLTDISYCNLYRENHNHYNICNRCYNYYKCGSTYNNNNFQNNSHICPKSYYRQQNY
jgi:hypothetical protein